ncbi:MAG: hypothetical protein CMD49_00490 [Gammaproteobacteria bacterium]|nr:hypothetical protein [Gammaproteobacteria bacterium]|tara:strand:- start:232 stop:468 length:237 start_codon:yes stop_codon:yes gene_type:complete
MADIEIGKVYTGKVKKIMDYGAFVNILPGKDGLVHISQIKQERVNNVRDEMSEGDEVQVKVLDIDGQGRVKLTMKDID